MGQIARFDTFLDFMFIVIVLECPELKVWLGLTSFYMIANFQQGKRPNMISATFDDQDICS